jgi:hypothetical protein
MAVHNNEDLKDKAFSNVIFLIVEIRSDGQLYVRVPLRGPFFHYEPMFQSPTIVDYLRNGYCLCLKV